MLFKIAFSNIRKRKGASFAFFIMVIISALMLSISFSLMLGTRDFYDKKLDELNGPHYSNFIMKSIYEEQGDKLLSFVKNYDGVTDINVSDGLFSTGSWHLKTKKIMESTNYFLNENSIEESFYKIEIIDKLAVEPENSIILPLGFKTSGIKAGDKIRLEIWSQKYEFTAYGFYEDTIGGASTSSISLVYIDNETFNSLAEEGINFAEAAMLMVRFKNSELSRQFKSDFRELINDNSNINSGTEVLCDESKSGAMTFVNMLAMIFILFSLIILAIAFIVVNFSIKNSISEDIATIGSLKSIGYKNKALRASQLLQYILIAVIGSIIGSVITLLGFSFIGNIIASTSGLLWLESVNVIPVILTIFILCALTLLIIYLATRKYKKITPINALRQGESHHSFKRNPMPLEKHKMPLTLHLGTKRIFNSVKNRVTLFIVIALLTFVSLVTYILSYNLNEDTSAMVQMAGLESADIWAQSLTGANISDINDNLKLKENVDHTLLTGSTTCYVNDYNTFAETCEDYSKLNISTLVKGEYPQFINQICLGTTTAKAIGKDKGDWVTLKINGKPSDYIIVGITQSIGSNGEGCSISYEAMLNQNSEFKMGTIYIYLKSGVDVKAYGNILINEYKNDIMMIIFEDQMDSLISSLGEPLSLISMIMIVLTVIIIAFVLFLIISTLIKRQKKEFGIMKALGYKNRHLILQTIISFLPSLLLGAILGIILGCVATNPLLGILFGSMGLLKAYFIVPIALSVVIGLSLFAVSVLISYIISLRLRKISPIKLIVEN